MELQSRPHVIFPASTTDDAHTVDVSVLIVCYKSRDMIEECLRGLFNHTHRCRYEVLLLDCSNDGAMDIVRAAFPQARIIDNSENLGYGRGNNLLAASARGRFVLLLNPDVIITSDAVSELYEAAINMTDAGAIGGRTVLPDGSRDPGCRQVVPTVSRLLVAAIGGARFMKGGLPETATDAADVDTLSGAFMLVRTNAWREVKGFDEGFFMYCEEVDLCQRLRAMGWRIVMTPKAEVIHLVGSGHSKSPQRIKLIYTARMHFFRKYWSIPGVVAGGCILWLHALIRVIVANGMRITAKHQADSLHQAYVGVVASPHEWWCGFQKLS
jgi:N-acetylglucosaminyl-diphospho-decaprenol L-rhamnosyltransferase